MWTIVGFCKFTYLQKINLWRYKPCAPKTKIPLLDIIRHGYSTPKKLAKLIRPPCHPPQLPGHQDPPALSPAPPHQPQYPGRAPIGARSVENWISVKRLITLYTDLQSILENINKFAAGQTNSSFKNNRSSRSQSICSELFEIF